MPLGRPGQEGQGSRKPAAGPHRRCFQWGPRPPTYGTSRLGLDCIGCSHECPPRPPPNVSVFAPRSQTRAASCPRSASRCSKSFVQFSVYNGWADSFPCPTITKSHQLETRIRPLMVLASRSLKVRSQQGRFLPAEEDPVLGLSAGSWQWPAILRMTVPSVCVRVTSLTRTRFNIRTLGLRAHCTPVRPHLN